MFDFIHLDLTQWSTRWSPTEGLAVRTLPHFFASLCDSLLVTLQPPTVRHYLFCGPGTGNRNRNRNRPVSRSEPNRTRFRAQPGTGQHCPAAASQSQCDAVRHPDLNWRSTHSRGMSTTVDSLQPCIAVHTRADRNRRTALWPLLSAVPPHLSSSRARPTFRHV